MKKSFILYVSLFLTIFSLLLMGAKNPVPKILILGDSITEGYGIEKEKAFPQLLQNQFGPKVQILNGGSSGSTTSSGMSRLKWHMTKKPDVVLIALGSNDGLRGISPAETQKNIVQLIQFLKKNNVKVLLCGLQVPPSYGSKYAQEFAQIWPKIVKLEKIPLYPFLLKDVAGVKKFNQEDGIHPNILGHQKIATALFPFIQKNLEIEISP
jgi:acyl-CoA thioesterase-1